MKDNKHQYKEIGKKIKMLRTKLGYSQEELSKRMGYSYKSSITKIEKGERDVPLDKISLLSKILQTTPEYLLGWEDKKSKIKQDLCLFQPKLFQDLKNKQLIVEALFFDSENPLTEEEKESLKNAIAEEFIKIAKSRGKL